MTLEYELDSLEGLEENISSLYTEKDGKFYLDVTGFAKSGDKNKIPRHRLNQEIDKRKAAEMNLATIAEDLKKDVPEEMQGIGHQNAIERRQIKFTGEIGEDKM